MDLLINIFLAIFGLGATLSAFGGATWIKGTKPLLKRITYRGWISLTCISLAFSIGIFKEINNHNKNIEKAIIEDSLRKQASEKQEKIDEHVVLIAQLQSQIAQSQKDVTKSAKSLVDTTKQLGNQQLSSIEAAFSMAVKVPREMDDWVINLNGENKQIIPSRLGGKMLLYWGDIFDYTFVPPRQLKKPEKPEPPKKQSEYNNYQRDMQVYNHQYERYMREKLLRASPSPKDLASLKLRAGEREYSLHDGKTDSYYSKSIRIYNDNPKPMEATILNPKELANVKIKIFVRSTDSTRGQKEFRRLVLNSAFNEFAKNKYKVTLADILRMRETPSKSARILSQLPHGSFVKVLQTSDGWSEVLTPEGRQGWAASEFIGEIN